VKSQPDVQNVSASFREWTRGTSFVLAMGKTQVATLVSLHASQEWTMHDPKHRGFYVGWGHRALKLFVTAVHGLQDRGLVTFSNAPSNRKTGEQFHVTEAGAAVVALLQIAGVYQELLAEFEDSDRRRMRASA
jgi:hypothetical protein